MAKKERRKKVNKYEELNAVQAEFDFHDKGLLTMDEVREMADGFIEECREKGLSRVLIITGKGMHSDDGVPKIKPFLMDHLSRLPYILRVSEARRDRGGGGALEVVLD